MRSRGMYSDAGRCRKTGFFGRVSVVVFERFFGGERAEKRSGGRSLCEACGDEGLLEYSWPCMLAPE